jgi:integrase
MPVTVRERKQGRGGWEVDIRTKGPNGEPLRWRGKSPLESKSASKRWGEELARKIALGGLPEKSPKPSEQPAASISAIPTLVEFAPRYTAGFTVANRQKHSTAITKESHLRNHLLPLLGAMPIDQIGAEQVQALKTRLAEKSAKYTNNVLATLSTILKVAVEWGVIDELPKVGLLPTTIPKMDFYDFDEYERLVDAAAKIDPRVLLVVLLGGDAGLRPGEVRALKWQCVDLQRRSITVELAEYRGSYGSPKHGKIRRVPLTKRLAEALAKHRHLAGDFVIYRDNGKPLTFSAQRKMLCKALRRATLELTGPHRLRHSWCSHLAMRGAPAKAIQELAGHSDLQTTQKYMHLSPAALEQSIQLLDRGREKPVSQVMDDSGITKSDVVRIIKKR